MICASARSQVFRGSEMRAEQQRPLGILEEQKVVLLFALSLLFNFTPYWLLSSLGEGEYYKGIKDKIKKI